jgi:hypothetical protein
MREKWQPLVEAMPFFDFCAGFIPTKQPFHGMESYVLNPGRPLGLCMLYTPEIVRYGAESEKSLLSYCRVNNYTAYIYRSSIYPGIPPTWQKGRVILNHLSEHEVIVWLDADTLILSPKKRVFENLLTSLKHCTSPAILRKEVPHSTAE